MRGGREKTTKSMLKKIVDVRAHGILWPRRRPIRRCAGRPAPSRAHLSITFWHLSLVKKFVASKITWSIQATLCAISFRISGDMRFTSAFFSLRFYKPQSMFIYFHASDPSKVPIFLPKEKQTWYLLEDNFCFVGFFPSGKKGTLHIDILTYLVETFTLGSRCSRGSNRNINTN